MGLTSPAPPAMLPAATSVPNSTLVMRLPKEKVLFAVDFIPVGTVPGRGMLDFYPI